VGFPKVAPNRGDEEKADQFLRGTGYAKRPSPLASFRKSGFNLNNETLIMKTDPINNLDRTDGDPDHPVGTGVGAAGGAMAGAAIGTAAGPVGTALGAVVGAVAGAMAGHGVAEAIDPAAEDAYWRSTHSTLPFAKGDYDAYQPGYRTGYEGYSKVAPGTRFEEAEATLKGHYETIRQGAKKAVRWDEAKPAVRAAWDRVDKGEAVRVPISESK